MTKLTKKMALDFAIMDLALEPHVEFTVPGTDIVFTGDEVVAKLREMAEQVSKKSTGEKALTENQKQNINFKDDILDFLADGKQYTATEILHGVPTFPKDMTNQRVSQLLRQLWLDGKVKKEPVKGKTMFSFAEGV